jgi:DNA (cytosine-5)-methyltransferase 1
MIVFDGVIRSGDNVEALYGVPFQTLSIGNLALPTEHNINNQVWIQSRCGEVEGVWYELGRPAAEYKKYWEAFEWMALFVKYVSDALESCIEQHKIADLKYFRQNFAADIRRMHNGDSKFERWMAAFGRGSLR